MSGTVPDEPTEENDFVYKSNIQYAAKILEAENLMCVIEPINEYSVPNYYLNSYDKGTSSKYIVVCSINILFLKQPLR